MNIVAIDDIINIVIRAGTMILENGGETYRAEDTIVHTAKSLGAKNPSAFVTPTVVMFSCTDDEDQHHCALRRISIRSVHLRKIARVNALSRRLERRGRVTNPHQVNNLLDRINKAGGYKPWFITVCAAFSSLCFAFLFGAGLREAFAALIIGTILRIFLFGLEKLPVNSLMRSLFSGALISFLADSALVLGLIPSSVTVVTAVLMQVVPGLAMVNAIRDIIAGDLVAGNARLVDACMTAVGLSVGSVFGLVLFAKLIFPV